MSFQQISYLAQTVASIGVIVSLIFVGLQIRQNTRALERAEAQFYDGTIDGDPAGVRPEP